MSLIPSNTSSLLFLRLLVLLGEAVFFGEATLCCALNWEGTIVILFSCSSSGLNPMSASNLCQQAVKRMVGTFGWYLWMTSKVSSTCISKDLHSASMCNWHLDDVLNILIVVHWEVLSILYCIRTPLIMTHTFLPVKFVVRNVNSHRPELLRILQRTPYKHTCQSVSVWCAGTTGHK